MKDFQLVDPTPARSPRKAKGKGPERREEILEHALRLFTEHGMGAVSTRQLAQAVGISQPSLYAYFRSHEEIAEELCVRAFGQLAQDLRAALEAAPDDQRMLAGLRCYVDFGLRRPNDYRVAFILESHPKVDLASDAFHPVLSAGLGAYNVLRGEVARVIGESAEVDLVAQSVWAGLHGLVSLLITRPEFPWSDRERLIDSHIARLARSIPQDHP